MTVLTRIEGFLDRSEMAASQFGRHVANDPRLVHDLRNGREPRPRMVTRIDAYLASQESVR